MLIKIIYIKLSPQCSQSTLGLNKTMANKKNNKLPIRKFDKEEAKRMAIINVQAGLHPISALSELAEKQLPFMPVGTEISKKVWKNMYAVSLTYGVESGLVLAENTPERYRSLALQMKRDIEKEFCCEKIHEKALVDKIVSAYIRGMECTWRLERSQHFELHSNYRNNYFFFLSKEIDRSFRQYISGLDTLKSLKQPEMNIKLNIKSKNAFVAGNQQFNVNKNNEPK